MAKNGVVAGVASDPDLLALVYSLQIDIDFSFD